MYYGGRTYQEWQVMSPADRDDYIRRLNEARAKEAKQQKESMGNLQQLLSGMFQGKGPRWQ